MLVSDHGRVHKEGIVGHEDAEVRIVAGRDPAFLLQASQLRRALRHPGGDVCSENPFRRAAGQDNGSPSCSEEMPPQAVPKSPVSVCFIAGVAGEWSETTRSSAPARSPSHSSSRLAASRTGGLALHAVAPLAISSELRIR